MTDLVERLLDRSEHHNDLLVEAATALASLREERDRLREQTQMPPPRGKMYCHPDDAPLWHGLRADNISLRERVRVLEGALAALLECADAECVSASAYEPILAAQTLLDRTNEPSQQKEHS